MQTIKLHRGREQSVLRRHPWIFSRAIQSGTEGLADGDTIPWSTDWISEEGKEKLNAFGIAPPNGKASEQYSEGKPRSCPQCGSTETELICRFGATPCKATCKCLSCLEPF